MIRLNREDDISASRIGFDKVSEVRLYVCLAGKHAHTTLCRLCIVHGDGNARGC